MRDPGLDGLRPVVEKELLHHELLFMMERGGFLDDLTFQGGTSLRLCQGAPRFSEDLDFSGGPGFEAERMAGLPDALEKGLAEHCGLDASVTLPKSSRRRALSEGVSVSSWRIAIPSPSGGRDLPALRVKLDIDNAPSHTREVRRVTRHLPRCPIWTCWSSRRAGRRSWPTNSWPFRRPLQRGTDRVTATCGTCTGRAPTAPRSARIYCRQRCRTTALPRHGWRMPQGGRGTSSAPRRSARNCGASCAGTPLGRPSTALATWSTWRRKPNNCWKTPCAAWGRIPDPERA